jgi:protein TorT
MRHVVRALAAAACAVALTGCGAADGTSTELAEADVPQIFKDPIPILRPNPDDISKVSKDTWTLSTKTTGDWNVCASFPTMKDPYWLAANYGLVTQAQRLGIQLTVLDAGGYDQLSKQVSDLEDCVSSGADAVLVAAISGEGVKSKVDQIVADGIPVIETVNRVESPNVTARSTIDFRRLGVAAAEQLIQESGGEALRVAWFPGPEGAGWAVRMDDGFKSTLAGSQVEVVETKWGDTARDEQLRLVEDTIQAHKDLDWIVGVAAAAEAAHSALDEAGRADSVKLASTYQTEAVAQSVERGEIDFSGNDNVAWMSAMALDLAVRHLDGDDMTGTEIWPEPSSFTSDDPVDTSHSAGFAPSDFQPVFKLG